MIIPVILAGGNGTRLWPLSRSAYPKQFQRLVGDETLLQGTVERVCGIAGIEPPLVVCNRNHRFIVAEQLREIGIEGGGILLGPCSRNTAPAIAVAALVVAETSPEALMLVLPSDHLIADAGAFETAIGLACNAARNDRLVTFGVVPTRPETGYGYIRAAGAGEVETVVEFVEKPDRASAERYLASGVYSWNSGMFLFKASRIIEELERHVPEIPAACRRALEHASHDMDFVRLDERAFGACPNVSIDYAVMEKTDRATVVRLDAGWSDLGAWDGLFDVMPHDASGNVVVGDVLAMDCHDSYLRAEERLVAAIGLSGCIVVETADAVLVADRARAQDVKKLVERLQKTGRREGEEHRRVYRPSGYYESVVRAPRFQVKRIVVKPQAALSLQKHLHRAEHWVVVSGTAQVTHGDTVRLLSEDQSAYIPLGVIHRLENPGSIPLELIEVQSGSYLGEDDIIRVEDRYQR